MPETSRSFYCWQPAPGWRPLPWLANPGNLAISPHAEGEKTGTRHTDKTVERKGRDRGGETVSKESPRSGEKLMLEMLTKTPTKRCNALWTKSTRNPGACIYSKLLTVASSMF